MSILSQIIAYSPNKIDTEKKAKGLLLAEGPRSEMGGRMGYKKGKLAIQTPKVLESGDSKAIRELDPEFKGKLIDKKTNKVLGKIYTRELNDAFEVLNVIRKNKGHAATIEEIGRLAGFIEKGSKTGKVNFKRAKLALKLAVDQFDELENFKLASEKYSKIDKKKFRYLDMVAKSFANYNKTADAAEAAAHLLPENMGMIYDLGGKENLEKGFFNVRGKITPTDKKFLVERISTLTGNKFNVDQVNELIEETSKVRTAKGSKEAQIKIHAKMNNEIVKLSQDNTIQKLLKNDLNRKTQTKLINRAAEIVGGDVSVASRRLFQMAQAMSDTTNKYKDLGININNNTAKKIIDTGKELGGVSNRYAMSQVVYDYYGSVVDKALGATEGETFIGKYQSQIRNLLDKGQSPDEIFSLTASARRGLSPYAIFTQNLRTDVNSAIKGAFIDSALSRKHDQLQKIFQGKTYDKLNTADKEAVQSIVDDFEKIKKDALNKPINPGAVKKGAKPIYLTAAEKKNIQLPEFDLKNPPSKSIEGFETRFKKYPKIKKAFEESYAKVGYGMKVSKDMKTQKQVITNLLQEFETRGCGKAAGGRILFSNGGEVITKCAKKGVAGFIDDLKKGNYSKATMNILKGGGNVIKNVLNPMELLKLRNYFGPVALGFMAAYEGGVITDDVVRQGTPLNESLANNWLTKSFLPYTKDYAKAKNLLETGKVPSNMKKYVEDVVTFNEGLKEVGRIEDMKSSRIIDDSGYGMIDGSSVYSQEQEDKDVNNLIKKMSTISENVVTPGTAKSLEMKSLQDEMEATRMAKKQFSPLFGFDKLKDVRTPGYTGYDYVPDEQPIDLRPITYMDAEYEDVKTLPDADRKKYKDYFTEQGILQPKQSLSELKYGDSNVYEELLKDYNKSQRAKQASQYPGYYGTQEKFMEGGIASLNVKK